MAENGPVIAAGYRPRPPAPSVTREQIQALHMPTLLIDGSKTSRSFALPARFSPPVFQPWNA
jgi:hypothetical protein